MLDTAERAWFPGAASVAGGRLLAPQRDGKLCTPKQPRAEIPSYSRSQGLFAGIDPNGGVPMPDQAPLGSHR
jgi:lipid-binding SYLF domain-containing protein